MALTLLSDLGAAQRTLLAHAREIQRACHAAGFDEMVRVIVGQDGTWFGITRIPRGIPRSTLEPHPHLELLISEPLRASTDAGVQRVIARWIRARRAQQDFRRRQVLRQEFSE
jgi:hypothetical protein